MLTLIKSAATGFASWREDQKERSRERAEAERLFQAEPRITLPTVVAYYKTGSYPIFQFSQFGIDPQRNITVANHLFLCFDGTQTIVYF